jgi:hypothetical protein
LASPISHLYFHPESCRKGEIGLKDRHSRKALGSSTTNEI